MPESREIENLRQMAWERAKGELRSILHTYWDMNPALERLEPVIENFITDIQENGYGIT